MSASKPISHDHSHHHSHSSAHGCDGDKIASRALTPARQRILDVLVEARQPLGAYDIINQMAQKTGKSPAPISVYRALDYLVEQGWVHRLTSRNAFLACGHGHHNEERVAFLICDVCGIVTEVMSADLLTSLADVAKHKNFDMRHSVIELTGVCASCQNKDMTG
jgi:Fur family zinc uptake transcriptional regulator